MKRRLHKCKIAVTLESLRFYRQCQDKCLYYQLCIENVSLCHITALASYNEAENSGIMSIQLLSFITFDTQGIRLETYQN